MSTVRVAVLDGAGKIPARFWPLEIVNLEQRAADAVQDAVDVAVPAALPAAIDQVRSQALVLILAEIDLPGEVADQLAPVNTALAGLAADVAARETPAGAQAKINAAITNLINASPAALDTLAELATALGNDPNFATTITNLLATKAPLASPALTGAPTAPTPATGTATTQIATTAFVAAQIDASATGVHPFLTLGC